jgi:hypothetical protein
LNYFDNKDKVVYFPFPFLSTIAKFEKPIIQKATENDQGLARCNPSLFCGNELSFSVNVRKGIIYESFGFGI